ncbi:sugar ABC transporter substrate-binding protein [Kineococcus aurantiacus]|uniref:sugar ABC transporter substrate-binding protein n=1 Tax=Kineococcus aurantiacus TaxID=37633 RepID=UPI0031CF0D63
MPRRSLLKGMGLGALSLPAGVALASCSDPAGSGTAGGAPAGDAKVVLASVPTTTNEYFTLWQAGGSEAAEALGLTYRMQSYNGSSATQIEQLRSASTAGVGQVVTFPINNDAVRQMGQSLSGQDIKLVTAFAATAWMVPAETIYGNDYVTLFTPREVLGQKAMSEAVFEAIGGSGNVLYLQGAPTNRTSLLRESGFDQAVAAYPGIKVLDRQNGNENGQDTRPVVQAWMSKYDNIDAIISHNSSSALGAVSVLEEAGNTHIKVGGTDEIAVMLDKLISGPNVVACQSIFGIWLGGYGVVRNYDAMNGVPHDPVEEMIFQDSLVIDTPDAAKEYKRITNQGSTGFDWKAMSRHLNPDAWDSQVAIAPIDPVPFFEQDLKAPKPADYSFPDALQKSLDAGKVQSIGAEYQQHVRKNPYAAAIKLTSTGKTVFGISYDA